MPVAQLASRLSTRGWLILGGAAVVGILFVYLFLHTISQPSYSTLVSGVEPSQTGKMTSTLSAHGVNYQLQNNGTALAVQSNQTAEARVALAGAGLLGNTQPGFSLFEKHSLGESNFQQQVTYQRALQGQLEETIDSVQGVSGAQVELVLPSAQNQIFGETQNTSSAAVLLSGTSSLDPGSVRGIAQLVASSVPGLQLSKVTITDSAGALLWPQAGGASSAGSTSVQEAEQHYNQATAASLDAMLAQTLGPGKAQVLVYANMNVDQTTQESLTYGKAGVPLQQSKDTETLTGTGAGTGGVTGTANLGAQTAAGKSNYKRETTNSSLGVDKTVVHSTIAPG
ncbi:MAG TPA: flagellar basal-body MS-ring/collar protein FliF, partial [Solirubrobacteraceae bacterium]|nr:flagellar basal-body MS-ring/collar protein FliF [Solirubrobacteraceae bacterium]